MGRDTLLYVITILLIVIVIIVLIVVFISGSATCTRDDECGAGSCYRGSCIDLAPVTIDTKKCVTNDQCNFGEYCSGGVCIIEQCQVLSDCPSGTFCDGDVCTTGKVICISDADTTPGCQALDPCTTTSQCGNGLRCFQGVCQRPGLNGQPCLTISDCILGSCSNFQCLVVAGTCTTNVQCEPAGRCSLGICVPLQDLGEACTQNSDCSNNYCSSQGVCVGFAQSLGQSCVVSPCQIGLNCDSNGICQTGPLPQAGESCLGFNNCEYGYYCGLNSVCVIRNQPLYSSVNLRYNFYVGVADEQIPVSFDQDDIYPVYDGIVTIGVQSADIITDYLVKFAFTNQLPQLRKMTKYTGVRIDDSLLFQRYILDTETPLDPNSIYTASRTSKDLYYYSEYFFGTTPLYRYTIPIGVSNSTNFHAEGHQFISTQSTYTLPGNLILEGQLIGFSIN